MTIYMQDQWQRLLEDTNTQIEMLSTVKGGEYAAGLDRLINFRRASKMHGVPMELVWAIYAGKHWDAVMQYVNDVGAGVERPRLEPISGRLDDLIVYCILLKAMIEERGCLQK